MLKKCHCVSEIQMNWASCTCVYARVCVCALLAWSPQQGTARVGGKGLSPRPPKAASSQRPRSRG